MESACIDALRSSKTTIWKFRLPEDSKPIYRTMKAKDFQICLKTDWHLEILSKCSEHQWPRCDLARRVLRPSWEPGASAAWAFPIQLSYHPIAGENWSDSWHMFAQHLWRGLLWGAFISSAVKLNLRFPNVCLDKILDRSEQRMINWWNTVEDCWNLMFPPHHIIPPHPDCHWWQSVDFPGNPRIAEDNTCSVCCTAGVCGKLWLYKVSYKKIRKGPSIYTIYENPRTSEHRSPSQTAGTVYNWCCAQSVPISLHHFFLWKHSSSPDASPSPRTRGLVFIPSRNHDVGKRW